MTLIVKLGLAFVFAPSVAADNFDLGGFLSQGKNLIMVKRSDYPHQPRPPHARLVMGGDSILININFTALHIEFLWHHCC